jgi:hypothetical protein
VYSKEVGGLTREGEDEVETIDASHKPIAGEKFLKTNKQPKELISRFFRFFFDESYTFKSRKIGRIVCLLLKNNY